jgi:hypothetical protein
MDKRDLKRLLPVDQNDEATAKHLVSLGIDAIRPIVPDMLRWLRVSDSPVERVFSEFFAVHGEKVANEVNAALSGNEVGTMKYVVVTKVLPRWPKSAVAILSQSLQLMVTHSDFPEVAIMSLTLLDKHGLADHKWLSGWLDFIVERLSRNLKDAEKLKSEHFHA